MFVSCYLDVVEMTEIHGAPNKYESGRPLYRVTVVRLSGDELDKAH